MTCEHEKSAKNLNEVLNELEEKGACEGYENLWFTEAKLYLRDVNGISIRLKLPKEFFITEEKPDEPTEPPTEPIEP